MSAVPVGIDHSKAVIADIADMAAKVIGIVKHLSIFKALSELKALEADVKDLIKQAPLALPELKTLDAAEGVEIAEAAYGLVQKIMQALVA